MRTGPCPLRVSRVFASALREPQTGMFPPLHCREGKFGRCYLDCLPCQLWRAAWGHNQHPGILLDNSAKRSRSGPLSRRRAEVTTPELRAWVRGCPAKQDGEVLGFAGAPGAGFASSPRLPALSGVVSRRLAPLPARPAASRRAHGSAPRPGRRSAGDPSAHCDAVS